MTQEPSGWYADPTHRHTYRFWDGSRWSNQVTDGGPAGLDPIDLEESIATTPPAPGTQAPGMHPTEDRPQPPDVAVTQRSGGSSLAGILGVLVGAIIVIVILVIVFNDAGDDPSVSTDGPTATVATTQVPETTEAPPTTAPPTTAPPTTAP